ncbi:MAG: LytTR family DNA-binding domain-containing protein [Clostridia bacterium]
MRIAICDDVKSDRDTVLKCLSQIEENHRLSFEINEFKCGNDLCEDLKYKNFDLILLDIVMDGLTGIETAKLIRSRNINSMIIFISSFDERIRELFGYNVIAFIDKPVIVPALEPHILKICNMMKTEKNSIFCYNKNKSNCYVHIKELLYFESNNNNLIIKTEKETIKFRGKITDVWKNICENKDFVMPSRSFICNLQHCTLNKNNITLNCGNFICTIGRKYRNDTLERYMSYLERRL